MLRGEAPSVKMGLRCFGSAPFMLYHCKSVYGMYDFYAAMCPLRPARPFMSKLVTYRSKIYDISESFAEDCLCAGVSADWSC